MLFRLQRLRVPQYLRPLMGRRNSSTDAHGHASRRDFLRRAGLTGAVAAAIVGGIDLAGMSSASATADPRRLRPAGPKGCTPCTYVCTYHKGEPGCHGTCPSGQCCYLCVSNAPSVCPTFSSCIGGHKDCASFEACG